MIRVADYIADFIYRQGTKDIFMLSGGGSIYLDDGAACNKNINSICVRHEATAPMMAEAYARLTHNIGVIYVTTGPGGTNAISGLVEAWVDSAPILVISGQVQRDQTSYNTNIKNLRTFGTQELNIIKIIESITKYSVMINDPNSIRYHLEKAVYIAKSGRPGPVWIDVPLDVQSAVIDDAKLEGYQPEQMMAEQANNYNRYIDINTENIIKLLKKSKRPLIIAGQGIRIAHAIDEFKKLIEYLNIPVIFSRLGQDILPFSHNNNLGHGGTQGSRYSGYVMKQSDLIISLGSRLAIPFIGTNLDAFSEDAKIVMVDIDDAELKKPSIKIDLLINADVKDIINKLLDKLSKERISKNILPDHKNWINECINYKEKYPIFISEQKKNPIDLYYFVIRLDALSNENNIFVSDAGSSYYVTGQALRFEKGQREITSGAFASMGVAIPLAIGCSIANKDSQILTVTGDGSLELNIQELKTVSYYNLNIKLFIINNGGYASIRNTQDDLCEGRYIGSDQAAHNELLNLRNVAIAFDLPYHLIELYENIDNKILEVMNQKGPAFIEVVCDNKQKIIKSSKEII